MRRITGKPRHGYTTIVVIALLSVAAVMFVGWTHEALRAHRQARRMHERAQAEWLAYAGLARATSQMQADGDYDGETWTLAPQELSQSYDAAIEISLDASDGITCRVRIPATGDHEVQLTRTFPRPNLQLGENE